MPIASRQRKFTHPILSQEKIMVKNFPSGGRPEKTSIALIMPMPP
jgi:hypothetical protein